MFNPMFYYEMSKTSGRVTIFEIDTRNTITGSSGSASIRVPFNGNFYGVVDWGDGNREIFSLGVTGFLDHTYATSGIYTIKIKMTKGYTFKFLLNNNADREKFTKLLDWGYLEILSGSFYGAKNIDMSEVNGKPILSSSMQSAFRSTGITTIKGLSTWDTSIVLSMNQTFALSTKFNQDFSMLNLSNVTTMATMMNGCTLFNQDLSPINFNINVNLTQLLNGKTSANYSAIYYSNLLIKLASIMIGSGRSTSKVLGCGTVKYTSAGISARAALVADGWVITDGGLV